MSNGITGKIKIPEFAQKNPWVVLAVILTMVGGMATQTKILLAKVESAEKKADSAQVSVARIEGMVMAMYQMQMAQATKSNLPVVEAKMPPGVDTVFVPVVVPVDSVIDSSKTHPR